MRYISWLGAVVPDQVLSPTADVAETVASCRLISINRPAAGILRAFATYRLRNVVACCVEVCGRWKVDMCARNRGPALGAVHVVDASDHEVRGHGVVGHVREVSDVVGGRACGARIRRGGQRT